MGWRERKTEEVYSEAEIEERLAEELSGWTFKDGWIRRKYKTSGWKGTLMVVNTVGHLAEAAWHHPDLELGYAQLKVKLQTHRVGGITPHDVALAERIEELATWLPDEDSPLEGNPKTWVH